MKLNVYHILIIILIMKLNKIVCFILNENDTNIKNYFILSTLINFNETEENLNKRKKRNHKDCIELSLLLNDQLIKLCLIKDNDLFASILVENASVIVENGNEREIFKFNDINITHTSGYVLNKPYSSSISGYIERHRFFGKINIEYKCYYVDRVTKFPIILQKYDLNANIEDAIVYERNLEYDLENLRSKTFQQFHKIIYQNKVSGNRKLLHAAITNKLCTLFLLIDNSFLRIITRNNIRESISIILHNVQESNSIFRSTDFNGDGIPDNIGFIVKYILIIDKETSSYNKLPKYTTKPYNGNLYLKSFSRHYYRFLKDVCLGIAFTAQTFNKNIIGLSYTPVIEHGIMRYAGGVCELPNEFGESQNTLVITYLSDNSGELIPQMITELSLAHELGHSFGADHDLGECYGHLMSDTTFKTLTYKNFMFSNCSKQKIKEMLKYKSYCMIDTNEPFCGNGILEDAEECDCGFPLYCAKNDICCIPRGTQRACSINKLSGYNCHPSQGLCCTSSCQYRDISHLGLSCKNFNKKRSCNAENVNSCGILGNCVKKSCHSIECTRIGLKECKCPPINDTNNSFCFTCCLDEKQRCLPAYNLTEIILKERQKIYNNFKKNYMENHLLKNVIVRNVCANGHCLNVSFRVFKKNNFCLYNGKLGFCNDYFQCVLNEGLQIYPKIRSINAANQKVSILSLLYFTIFLYIFWEFVLN